MALVNDSSVILWNKNYINNFMYDISRIYSNKKSFIAITNNNTVLKYYENNNTLLNNLYINKFDNIYPYNDGYIIVNNNGLIYNIL